MTPKLNLEPPSTLVIEYKSTSIIVRGIVLTIIVGVLLITTEALSNIIALAVLGIVLVVSGLDVIKAYRNTALIITDTGIKINDTQFVEWDNISKFFIKTILVDSDELQRIIINTENEDFKFDMGDLRLDEEKLNRWIAFYKQRRSSLTGR